MSYSKQLTIPANTSKEGYISQRIPIVPMRVDEVSIIFPAGCVGLVGCWFEYQSQRLWPFETNSYYIANDYAIVFRPRLWLIDKPLHIDFSAYNLDVTFQHTLYYMLDVTFEEDQDFKSLIALFGGSGSGLLGGVS